MVNPDLGKHCVVLDLGFPQRRAIVRYYYQLPCNYHTLRFNHTKRKKKKTEITKQKAQVPRNRKWTTFGVSEGLEHGFVPQGEFPALHHESEPVVDALMSLLLQKFRAKSSVSICIVQVCVNTWICTYRERQGRRVMRWCVPFSFRPPL